jgi:hypothetical protein
VAAVADACPTCGQELGAEDVAYRRALAIERMYARAVAAEAERDALRAEVAAAHAALDAAGVATQDVDRRDAYQPPLGLAARVRACAAQTAAAMAAHGRVATECDRLRAALAEIVARAPHQRHCSVHYDSRCTCCVADACRALAGDDG